MTYVVVRKSPASRQVGGECTHSNYTTYSTSRLGNVDSAPGSMSISALFCSWLHIWWMQTSHTHTRLTVITHRNLSLGNSSGRSMVRTYSIRLLLTSLQVHNVNQLARHQDEAVAYNELVSGGMGKGISNKSCPRQSTVIVCAASKFG